MGAKVIEWLSACHIRSGPSVWVPAMSPPPPLSLLSNEGIHARKNLQKKKKRLLWIMHLFHLETIHTKREEMYVTFSFHTSVQQQVLTPMTTFSSWMERTLSCSVWSDTFSCSKWQSVVMRMRSNHETFNINNCSNWLPFKKSLNLSLEILSQY